MSEMTKRIEDYIPYGEEWEKEMMKFPKKFLINLVRKTKTHLHQEVIRGKQECADELEELWGKHHLRREEVDNLIKKWRDLTAELNKGEENE